MMRDEDACMISKDLDLEWFRRHVGLRHLNRPLSPLDAAHIVPEAFFGFASIVDPEVASYLCNGCQILTQILFLV